MTTNVMNSATSTLVLVDYQERLLPVIHEADSAVRHALRLAQAARILGIPVIGTEQNPERLGPNLASLRTLCDQTMSKTHFDACPDGLVERLTQARPEADQVVVSGCESHVCLLQTALGLQRAGLQVWAVANACGSRRASDHAAAMSRLAQAGISVVTHEMALFEWVHDCRNPAFRDVLPLIKPMD